MQSQLQFFTDISHEIRTPLTLILTPIEELIKNTTDEKLKETYKIIDQNGHRILRLVNQVMEMRKLDKGQVKLLAEETDVNIFIQEIIGSFKHLAQEKNISFDVHIVDNLHGSIRKSWIKSFSMCFPTLLNIPRPMGKLEWSSIRLSHSSESVFPTPVVESRKN